MDKKALLIVISTLLLLQSVAYSQESWCDTQNKSPRVAESREDYGDKVKSAFEEAGVDYPPAEIAIVAYKFERQIELWARSDKAQPMKLIETFGVCAASGGLGPKCCEGDRQVPEGFYYVSTFNPQSEFYLSLGVNYPNSVDRHRCDVDDCEKKSLGGDIFIHGKCRSIGCLAIRKHIKFLYLAALDAKCKGGQSRIPVYIFPCRMTGGNLESLCSMERDLCEFWTNLREGYDLFNATRRPLKFKTEGGKYVFEE